MGQTDLSRRRMLQLMGVGAGSAALMGHGSGAAQAAAPLPFTPRGRLRRRPNFLVIIVDQMRYPPFMSRRSSARGEPGICQI